MSPFPFWSFFSVCQSALHLSIRASDFHQVSILLSNGADPEAPRCQSVQSPLVLAVSRNLNDIVDLLLQNGANPNSAGTSGMTAVVTAVNVGNLYALQALLASRADPNRPTSEGLYPLVLAARKRDSQAVNILCQAQIASDVLNAALATAIDVNSPDCVNLLLHHGADASNPTLLAAAMAAADPSIELILTSPERITSLSTDDFLKTIHAQIVESVNVIEDRLQSFETAVRRFTRFEQLLPIKKKGIKKEIAFLRGVPHKELNPAVAAGVSEVVRKLAQKTAETNAIRGRIERQICTQGGTEMIEQWRRASADREKFFQGLLGKCLAENEEAQSIARRIAGLKGQLAVIAEIKQVIAGERKEFAAAMLEFGRPSDVQPKSEEQWKDRKSVV